MKLKQIIILTFTASFLITSYIPSLARVTNVLIHTAIENQFDENAKKPVDLVFYLNGGGSNESYVLGPFILGGLDVPNLNNFYRKDLVFVSFAFNPSSHWSSPGTVKDVINNIHVISKKYNTRKIILIGISVGGSLALNILSNADNELKSKISKVLAVFPIIDYEYTVKNTKRQNILDDLNKHFSKSKDPKAFMKSSSPITYISNIPNHTKIVLIEGIQDTHVCSNQIEKYYSELKKKNHDAKLIKYNIDHTLEPAEKEFGSLVKSFLQ